MPEPAWNIEHANRFSVSFESARKADKVDSGTTSHAVLAVVDADEPPLLRPRGNYPLDVAKTDYTRRVGAWEAWSDILVTADLNYVVSAFPARDQTGQMSGALHEQPPVA